jgi:hypothetical protein
VTPTIGSAGGSVAAAKPTNVSGAAKMSISASIVSISIFAIVLGHDWFVL